MGNLAEELHALLLLGQRVLAGIAGGQPQHVCGLHLHSLHAAMFAKSADTSVHVVHVLQMELEAMTLCQCFRESNDVLVSQVHSHGTSVAFVSTLCMQGRRSDVILSSWACLA